MPRVMFTRISKNAKTGPIPTSTSESSTCPSSCSLKGAGCYAELGPQRMWWNKLDDGETGMEWSEFVEQVKRLPKRQLWRHNVAGDLPRAKGEGERVDAQKLSMLVSANKGKRGYTYTHYNVEENLNLILKANAEGFTINLSADSPAIAREYYGKGAPVVSVVPLDFWQGKNLRKIQGVEFVRCPAEYAETVSCASCGVCAKADRKSVIGFTVHGSRKHKANIIASDL